MTATDSDKGGHGDIRYYIRNGNTGVAFSINPFTGNIYVANVLDFDVAPTSYTLRLEAEDTASTQTDTRTGTVTLIIVLTDSNDHTPLFTQDLYTTTLDENVANPTSVLTVLASDDDTGSNGAITYSVVGGTGSILFSVHATTGVISTQATIDYEANIEYDLIVKAVDGGTAPLSATCFVRIAINDLNDNSPKFPAAHITVEITESTPIGTSVVTAVATDVDSLTNNNNVVVYSINPSSSKFIVNPSTGVITTNDALDRESQAR
ncbi:hypothetical protein DPMN_004362 [Dreissena polymorpha]|uniref:Cadherin domain-containing protein n=1 Tax=Dreissena polymorpha TaxID=45954 RepID=A0A9D4MQ40_DREPO|nr:hypothetical protein DPMN_004362 [Dreissena polymorpha]